MTENRETLPDQGACTVYVAEMWGDGSWGVIDVRPRIPRRVGACASEADAGRVARKMNEQHTVNERLNRLTGLYEADAARFAKKSETLAEAIDLMLCEIEGIEVGFENGCKATAIEVGRKALGLPLPSDEAQAAPRECCGVDDAWMQPCADCPSAPSREQGDTK